MPAVTSIAFEWIMGVLGVALVGGLNLDLWAHNHGKVDQSFFTPWHAVLYGAMALNGIALGLVAAHYVLRKKFRWQRCLPAGYGLSLVGVIVFAVGGVLDLVWHTLFGIEESIQALLSPTHLLLATSAALILTGPVRSAAVRLPPTLRARWSTHGPLVLSALTTATLIAFFTQFAHPLYVGFGAKDRRPPAATALYRSNLDASDQTRLIVDPTGDDWGPAVSPDGRRIAYRRAALGSAASDIYTADIDGSHPLRLTHTGHHDSQPSWSPDGVTIAFTSAPAATSGEFALCSVPAVGGSVTTLMHGVATINGPAWSPDGRKIAFGSRRGLREWIASVPRQGGATVWLEAGADGSWPTWSPDGRHIAFVRHQSADDSGIAVMDAAGKSAHVLRRGGIFPAWSRDGKRIAFVGSGGGTEQVYTMSADGSGVSDATRNPGLTAGRPAWISGSTIAFSGQLPARYEQSQSPDLGVASFLLQTLVLMGFVLLLVHRWRVPLGAMTLMLALNGFAMVSVSDQFYSLPWIVATGIAADLALLAIGSRTASGLMFYTFAFALPCVYAGLHLVAVGTRLGFGWPPNLMIGTPVVCGIAGLLLAYAFRPPLGAATQTEVA